MRQIRLRKKERVFQPKTGRVGVGDCMQEEIMLVQRTWKKAMCLELRIRERSGIQLER